MPSHPTSPYLPQSQQFAATASTWRVHLSQPVYRPYRLKPSLALAATSDASSLLVRQPSKPFPLRGRGASSTVLSAPPTPVPLAPPLPGWRVTVFFPCVLEDPFAEDIKVHALEEALGEWDDGHGGAVARGGSAGGGNVTGVGGSGGGGGGGGDSSMPQGAGTGSLLRRSHGFAWRELTQEDGAAFSVLVQPEVSRHALVRVQDEQGAEIGQGVICLRHAFLASAADASPLSPESEGGKGRARGRFGLPLLMGVGARRAGASGGLGEGVEVLLTNGGQAVANLRLQVKIRRHKN
jgi:hypothetical protein